MPCVFDRKPGLCGGAGGGTTDGGCPKVEMHKKSGVTGGCCGALIVGNMTVPQFLFEGQHQATSNEHSVFTAEAGRLDCRPGPCEKVWRSGLENVAGGRTLA